MQGREQIVHWYPWPSAKQQIVRTVPGHCGACGIIGHQQLRQMFGPAGFLVLFQLTDHADDHLTHVLHLTIGLSMVRQGSQLLHSIQFTEVCYDMACGGLPLITDKVGRCTEKPEIPNPQSLGGSACSPSPHTPQHTWRSGLAKPVHYE